MNDLVCCGKDVHSPLLWCLIVFGSTSAIAKDNIPSGHWEKREIVGWTVHVSSKLLANDAQATDRALELLKSQLEEIVRVVPPAAVVELKKVSLYMSPEYEGFGPSAEYHPDAGWLQEHGRDPAMEKGIEFTNVRIFEKEQNACHCLYSTN